MSQTYSSRKSVASSSFLLPFQATELGEKTGHASGAVENEGRYNDFVPLVYGIAWYRPPIVFARNDGNLTHLEVLLGMGRSSVSLKVVVNDIELPRGQSLGEKPTATGWFNVANAGYRDGNVQSRFLRRRQASPGDPMGAWPYCPSLSQTVSVTDERYPRSMCWFDGMKLPTYDNGSHVRWRDTSQTIRLWVLLDLLRRSGWAKMRSTWEFRPYRHLL